jgi:hypothetical protein
MESGNERKEFASKAEAIDYINSLPHDDLPASSDPLPPPLPEV